MRKPKAKMGLRHVSDEHVVRAINALPAELRVQLGTLVLEGYKIANYRHGSKVRWHMTTPDGRAQLTDAGNDNKLGATVSYVWLCRERVREHAESRARRRAS